MKGVMAMAAERLEHVDGRSANPARGGGNHSPEDLAEVRRGIYASAQWAGEVAFFEEAQPQDGPDCLFVVMVAVKDGALVRVPIVRNVGSRLAAEVVRRLT